MIGGIIVKSEFKMNFSVKMSVIIETVHAHSTDLKNKNELLEIVI